MRLAGISACVPKNKVETSAAYDNFKQFDVDRIIGNTGVKEKREAEPGVTTTDLCIAAAGPLLDQLGWERESVDAVVLVTSSPDYVMPASAHVAHRELGLSERCLVFDVNLGCSGFTHGMMIVESFIASGLVKRGLLLCGDMTSGTIRPRLRECDQRPDLANAILFGDAGTATALSAEGDDVRARSFAADGSGIKHIIVPGGAAREPWAPALFERRMNEYDEERRPIDLVLRGPEILTFTMKKVPPLLRELLEGAGWAVDDVDSFVLHQANRFMLDFLAKRMKLPKDRVPMSIAEYGNTSSASIPLTMVACSQGLMQPRTKWVMMGFGVGLSWSGLAMETEGVVSLPLIEV
ncbi:ketoacyl-ACP synthase III [Paraliomyxa miuraensis]|uniref:ketoacyl-ACP synthase III n=1 Tax=Paraliomyxa miuraensis TaxID=376150 RepID=UPI002258FE4D|nr:ketoacyl-ACP synthase III [Paraliomyxa miuraensis]MCX4246461.1 ketoacyl-ACP synthase III [Paraliomyxa miuraensis]